MKKISFLLACSMLFVGYTFGQSKKNKQSKYLPPQVQSDEPAKGMNDGDIVIKESSNCVGCTEKLTPSSLTIKNATKYGYVNSHGELIIPRIFDAGNSFSEGYAIVKMGNYYGSIDPHGSIVISMKYSSMRTFQKTSFIANSGGFYGIINAEGKELLPFIYNDIYVADDNLILSSQGKKGLYDFEQKKWVIPIKYKYINTYTEGHIMCTKENGKMDWYDRSTLILIDSSYTAIDALSPEYFIVQKGDFYGVVDTKNTIIVPIIYEEFFNSTYSTNYLIARKNNKYGIIAYDNRVLIDFVYENINSNNDLFIAQKNGLYGIIDKLTFKETTPCIYQDIRIYNSQRIFAKKNGFYGIIIRRNNC